MTEFVRKLRRPIDRRLAWLLVAAAVAAPTGVAVGTVQEQLRDGGFANPTAIAGVGTAATWEVVERTVHGFRVEGYHAVAAGTDRVGPYDLSWSVDNEYPKKVTLLVSQRDLTVPPDTFITYIHR